MPENKWLEAYEKARSFIFRRQKAYQLAFDTETGKMVLADLAKFCRAHESTFHPNADVSRQLDGRREVWLRIQQHLRLDSEQLWKLYGRNIDA